MSKQVKPANTVVQAAPASANEAGSERNLYVQVTTRNDAAKVIGTRIVDMYHFGTRNWLHNHQWWAMHNGHNIEVEVANPEDVAAYLADAKIKLAEKFNTKAA